jgi:hypothetical protein
MTAADVGLAGASAPVSPMLEKLAPRWSQCIVAATGPSLTPLVADRCAGWPVVAVNDAYRLIPSAPVLYACDPDWWELHQGCPDFAGEKWSSHDPLNNNDKLAVARRYGLRLVGGRDGEGFSFDPSAIHYGSNSGFQAINLALLMGARRILLVGFDMHSRGGRHFFGDHPEPLSNWMQFESLVPTFRRAARLLPPSIQIINCTPGSALDCFPRLLLEEALCLSPV